MTGPPASGRISRRGALGVLGGAAAVVVAAVAGVRLADGGEDDGDGGGSSNATTTAGLERIGTAYLADHPGVDAAELRAALRDVGVTPPAELTLAGAQQVLVDLADAIAADFDAGRVVQLDGWWLSSTEAQVAALVALG